MRRRLLLSLLSLPLCFAPLSAHASTVNGDQFSYVLQYDGSNYSTEPNFTAYGSSTMSDYPITVSITATQIIFSFGYDSSFTPGSFNGPVLTDLTENLPFNSLTLDPAT